MFKYIENGTITDVKSFFASGLHCGIKRKRKDLALIYSDLKCELGAVFTRNKFKAAPVLISESINNGGNTVRGILINSGNANACTGEEGFRNAKEIQSELTRILKLDGADKLLLSSTGLIGEQLPKERIIQSLPALVKNLAAGNGQNSAEAIMTTDTYPKSYSMELKLANKSFRIGAIAKGSGMIQPNMATMLTFISTDLDINKELLQEALNEAVKVSFNRITVDGEMSTNDMVLALANGASSVKAKAGSLEFAQFKHALIDLCKKIAIDIVRDGEGSTKVIEININNAQSLIIADRIAERLSNSLLIKTAIYGEDANWGRILSALGSLEIDFEPDHVEVFINQHQIIAKNQRICIDEFTVNESLKKNYVQLDIYLNNGEDKTQWWTTDLTEKYIDINAKYRT